VGRRVTTGHTEHTVITGSTSTYRLRRNKRQSIKNLMPFLVTFCIGLCEIEPQSQSLINVFHYIFNHINLWYNSPRCGCRYIYRTFHREYILYSPYKVGNDNQTENDIRQKSVISITNHNVLSNNKRYHLQNTKSHKICIVLPIAIFIAIEDHII